MVQCFVFLGSRLELPFTVAGAVHTCQVCCVDAVCLDVPEVWRFVFLFRDAFAIPVVLFILLLRRYCEML
jgi:hypothetical protein